VPPFVVVEEFDAGLASTGRLRLQMFGPGAERVAVLEQRLPGYLKARWRGRHKVEPTLRPLELLGGGFHQDFEQHLGVLFEKGDSLLVLWCVVTMSPLLDDGRKVKKNERVMTTLIEMKVYPDKLRMNDCSFEK
jgi:hypothetical protein